MLGAHPIAADEVSPLQLSDKNINDKVVDGPWSGKHICVGPGSEAGVTDPALAGHIETITPTNAANDEIADRGPEQEHEEEIQTAQASLVAAQIEANEVKAKAAKGLAFARAFDRNSKVGLVEI